MIEVQQLSKVYRGGKVAVDDLTFTVAAGKVTGFLGQNGAGKTTTMRLIVGLERASGGTALVDGRPFWRHPEPMRALGALLDARGAHPGRTLREHYSALAAAGGVHQRQVAAVIEMVGLGDVADRRIGGLSLGMGQRLGVGAALLGDPQTVMLDEPINGLDPDGVLWMRSLLRELARQGRSVFVSSHLMSEMALTADHLVVIGRGRLLADEPMQQFLQRARPHAVLVRSPDVTALSELLQQLRQRLPEGQRASSRIEALAGGGFEVSGLSERDIAPAALAAGLELHELAPQRVSLEEIFMHMTAEAAGQPDVVHQASPAASPVSRGAGTRS